MTTDDVMSMRRRVVAAILANPVAASEPRLADRLADPAANPTFEELRFDSLARMEFCIFMECEYGAQLNSGHLVLHPDVDAMAAYLARRD